MKVTHLTKEQHNNLKDRKKELEEVLIPENSSEIETAKEFGDLSENAEYHAAKDNHEKLMTELNEVKSKLSTSKIIKSSSQKNTIEIGHQVTVMFLNDSETFPFLLIGEGGNGLDEVDVESKLGSNVLGKRVGDVVEFTSPAESLGTLKYKIISIK